jgi:hypothetical protein
MSVAGVPAGGLKTVGQIVATNTLTFRTGQNGMAIAVELLSTHTAGAPVVGDQGRYMGFINEFDVWALSGQGEQPHGRRSHAAGPIAVTRHYDRRCCQKDGGAVCAEPSRREGWGSGLLGESP